MERPNVEALLLAARVEEADAVADSILPLPEAVPGLVAYLIALEKEMATLRAWRERAQPILEMIARCEYAVGRANQWVCVFYDTKSPIKSEVEIQHAPDCPITQARALLEDAMAVALTDEDEEDDSEEE